MKLPAEGDGITRSRSELEPILNALAEINVQLRQVLQMSKTVIWELETCSRITDAFEKGELESKNESILANMTRTEAAIGNINQEISALLQKEIKEIPRTTIGREVKYPQIHLVR